MTTWPASSGTPITPAAVAPSATPPSAPTPGGRTAPWTPPRSIPTRPPPPPATENPALHPLTRAGKHGTILHNTEESVDGKQYPESRCQRAASLVQGRRRDYGEGVPELRQERTSPRGLSKSRRSPPLWVSECRMCAAAVPPPSEARWYHGQHLFALSNLELLRAFFLPIPSFNRQFPPQRSPAPCRIAPRSQRRQKRSYYNG